MIDKEIVMEPHGNESPDADGLEPTEQERKSEADCHAAFHVLLRRLIDDEGNDSPDSLGDYDFDYSGILAVMTTLHKLAPENGVVQDVVDSHLIEIGDILLGNHDGLVFFK